MKQEQKNKNNPQTVSVATQRKENAGTVSRKGIGLPASVLFHEGVGQGDSPVKLTQLAGQTHSVFQAPVQREEKAAENKTGMSDQLKSGIESLSGIDMSDVRVNYNSSKPAQLNAHAYAQGNDIHIAPGQEQHVAHEAWHVVQQRQGRVQPTTSVNNMPVNDNAGLETEADVMGGKALQLKITEPFAAGLQSRKASPAVQQQKPVVQLLAVPSKTQQKTNSCWAACGFALHDFRGGAGYGSEALFVAGQGSVQAQKDYAANKPTDIDGIVGKTSVTNRLKGSDTSGSFSKSTISSEINNGNPIIASQGGVHYVVIMDKQRTNTGYELQVMDPDDGSTNWYATSPGGLKINNIGGFKIPVLYYTQ